MVDSVARPDFSDDGDPGAGEATLRQDQSHERGPAPVHSQSASAVPGAERRPEGVRSFALGLTIIAAAVCFVLGLTMPVIRLTQLFIWSDTHSLISIIQALYTAGEGFLATIILLFSVVFPALKLLYLLAAYTLLAAHSRHYQRAMRHLSWLGKWSMLDVLVLALVIFYAKSTGLSDAATLPGVYFFTASVLLSMLAYGLVKRDIG